MISNLKKQQKNFFDQDKNQYSSDLIINPPVHTTLEINEIINRLKNFNNSELIVDFAAGTGRITISLLKKEFKVVSVDISKKSLFKIRKLAFNLGLKNLKTQTVLPREGVKAIIGADALHHIDMDKYLSIFNKILIKGGKIVFSEPGAWNPAWYVYLGLFHDWQVEKGMVECGYFNLKRKLINNGFNKIKISGLGLLPRPFFNWFPFLCRLNDWLGNLPILKLFAYRYIIEAEK